MTINCSREISFEVMHGFYSSETDSYETVLTGGGMLFDLALMDGGSPATNFIRRVQMVISSPGAIFVGPLIFVPFNTVPFLEAIS